MSRRWWNTSPAVCPLSGCLRHPLPSGLAPCLCCSRGDRLPPTPHSAGGAAKCPGSGPGPRRACSRHQQGRVEATVWSPPPTPQNSADIAHCPPSPGSPPHWVPNWERALPVKLPAVSGKGGRGEEKEGVTSGSAEKTTPAPTLCRRSGGPFWGTPGYRVSAGSRCTAGRSWVSPVSRRLDAVHSSLMERHVVWEMGQL